MKEIYKLFLEELEFYKEHSGYVHSESKNISGSGTLVEMAIRKFLREIIGARFRVTHGYIYSSSRQKLSPQIDIIITDTLVPHSFKRFDYLDEMEIVPVEAVVGIFEVKRTLNEDAHEAAIEHLTKVFEFVPLKKDRQNRYLPGGIEITSKNGSVQVEGGLLSNPIVGILGLTVPDLKKIDSQDFKRVVDLCFSFDGYFKTYADQQKAYTCKICSCITATDELKYLVNDPKNSQMSPERMLQLFVGYLLGYLNEVTGRPFDMNNYFPHILPEAEKGKQ